MEPHVVEGVLDGVIRRGQVEVAGGDHHLHVGVLGHGVAQQARRIAKTVLDAVVPGLNAAEVGKILEC